MIHYVFEKHIKNGVTEIDIFRLGILTLQEWCCHYQALRVKLQRESEIACTCAGGVMYFAVNKMSVFRFRVWSAFVCTETYNVPKITGPGGVARSEASSLGMQAAPSSILTSGTFFCGDLVMKTFLQPFSFFRWFKMSSCQLLVKNVH